MALRISIPTSNVGVAFSDAYARITNVFARKEGCQYQVAVYATADARQAEAALVAEHAFYAPLPQGNLLDGLYADLKQQPGFEAAVDC